MDNILIGAFLPHSVYLADDSTFFLLTPDTAKRATASNIKPLLIPLEEIERGTNTIEYKYLIAYAKEKLMDEYIKYFSPVGSYKSFEDDLIKGKISIMLINVLLTLRYNVMGLSDNDYINVRELTRSPYKNYEK